MSERSLSSDGSAIAPNCPMCGAPTKSGMRFCTRCGQPLSQSGLDRAVKVVPTVGAAIDVISARLADERQLDSPRAAYFQLGLQLLTEARTALAVDAFELAAKEEGSSPDTSMLKMALGLSSAQAGLNDRALRSFLQSALDLTSMFSPLIQAAFDVLKADSAAVQLRWLQETWLPRATGAYQLPSERGLIHALYGASLLMVGDVQCAVQHFTSLPDNERGETWQAVLTHIEALDLPPTITAGEGEHSLLLGRIAESLGQTEVALDYVDRALGFGFVDKSNYPDAPAHALRGKLHEELGRTADAADSYLAAGIRYVWRKQTPDAVTQFTSALRCNNTSYEIHWRLADALLTASSVTKPPYVDQDKIAQCLDIWNRGTDIKLPDENYYWAYLTRAIMAQQLANLPGEDRWERYWETVTFVEQSLLLGPHRTYSWVTLAQLHFALGNDLIAIHANETALLCDPEDVGAIEQQIIMLTNLHRYVDVRPLLVKRKRMSPDVESWINAIETHLMLYESLQEPKTVDYKAILATLEASHSSLWEAPWSRIDRARLLSLAGHTKEAHKQYEELWGKFNDQEVDNQLSYAWAGMMIGEVEPALEIIERRSGDRLSSLTDVQRYLGFCRLLRGELASAQDHFNQSIELAISAHELDEWLIGNFESTEVLQLLANQPYIEQARQLLERCKASAAKRLALLQIPSTPSQEAQWIILAIETRNETTSWSWIGAHTTAARLNLETHCWREAQEFYLTLQNYPGRFFTAQEGLEQALYGLNAESVLPDDRTRLADLYNQRENLERRRRPTRIFGQTGMQRLPAVTPIAIEAAANLGSLLVGNDGGIESQFAQHLTDMRWGLDDLLGFTAPSVRIRLNELDLPDGTYIVMLNEIPVVSGNIELTQGLCNETVDRLTLLNVKAEEAVNPANGSECAWIKQDDWKKVQDAGLNIWTPAEYIVLHLSSIIRKNSAELVGIQAVADLLMEKAEAHRSKILSAQGGLPRFTSVIQALLAEEVPIKELPSICEYYLASLDLPTYEIPEVIRSQEIIRKGILGNTSETPIYRIGENFISFMVEGIKRDDEAAVLALKPEPTQDMLTAVRNEVTNLPPTTRSPVLFVDDWRMRPFVRKLVELEFPHLAVLSRREALDPDSMPVLATIEVDLLPSIQRQ